MYNIAAIILLRFPSCIPKRHVLCTEWLFWYNAVWDVRGVPMTLRSEDVHVSFLICSLLLGVSHVSGCCCCCMCNRAADITLHIDGS
jgi:hypothetical protein